MPRFIVRWVFMLRVMWRIGTGRWFAFRDAPDWLVFEMAAMLENDACTGEVLEMAQQAHEEAARRIADLKHRMERLIEESTR